MKAIYIIEDEKERTIIKGLFRKRVAELKEGGSEDCALTYMDEMICLREDGDLSAECLFRSDFGVVYDYNPPEMKDSIVIYDFTNGKVHLKDDTAALFDLPTELFPF